MVRELMVEREDTLRSLSFAINYLAVGQFKLDRCRTR